MVMFCSCLKLRKVESVDCSLSSSLTSSSLVEVPILSLQCKFILLSIERYYQCPISWMEVNIKAPSFNVTPHKLLKGPKYEMMDIGLSFDTNRSHHFYFIGNALANPKFIQFKVLMVYFSNIFHLLTVYKGGCSTRILWTYSAVVRLPNKNTVTPNVSWDFMSAKLTVTLLELSFPMILAFGLGTRFLKLKGRLENARLYNIALSEKKSKTFSGMSFSSLLLFLFLLHLILFFLRTIITRHCVVEVL